MAVFSAERIILIMQDVDLALKTALRWYNRPKPLQNVKAGAITQKRRDSYNQLLHEHLIELIEYRGEICVQMTDAGLARLQKIMPKVTAQFKPNRNIRNTSDEVIELVNWLKRVYYDGHQVISEYIDDPIKQTLTTDVNQAFTLPGRQWRDVKDYDRDFGFRGQHFYRFETMLDDLKNYHERKWYR